MDLISRKEAIEAICGKCQERCIPCEVYPCDDVIALQQVQAAEPEIIRCKDCKYFERYTDNGTFESVLKMHQWDGECSERAGHTYMGWFCSSAERRTE